MDDTTSQNDNKKDKSELKVDVENCTTSATPSSLFPNTPMFGGKPNPLKPHNLTLPSVWMLPENLRFEYGTFALNHGHPSAFCTMAVPTPLPPVPTLPHPYKFDPLLWPTPPIQVPFQAHQYPHFQSGIPTPFPRYPSSAAYQPVPSFQTRPSNQTPLPMPQVPSTSKSTAFSPTSKTSSSSAAPTSQHNDRRMGRPQKTFDQKYGKLPIRNNSVHVPTQPPQQLPSTSTAPVSPQTDNEPKTLFCEWDTCEQGPFVSEEALMRHVADGHLTVLNRNGDRDFSCKWRNCPRDGEPFNAHYQLDTHCLTHTGYKPHVCPVPGCGKRYSRLENYKTHERTHTGVKPYECDQCGKRFTNPSDKAKHVTRTHSDDKNCACLYPACEKRYTDPSSLRKHIINAHGEPEYERQSCLRKVVRNILDRMHGRKRKSKDTAKVIPIALNDPRLGEWLRENSELSETEIDKVVNPSFSSTSRDYSEVLRRSRRTTTEEEAGIDWDMQDEAETNVPADPNSNNSSPSGTCGIRLSSFNDQPGNSGLSQTIELNSMSGYSVNSTTNSPSSSGSAGSLMKPLTDFSIDTILRLAEFANESTISRILDVLKYSLDTLMLVPRNRVAFVTEIEQICNVGFPLLGTGPGRVLNASAPIASAHVDRYAVEMEDFVEDDNVMPSLRIAKSVPAVRSNFDIKRIASIVDQHCPEVRGTIRFVSINIDEAIGRMINEQNDEARSRILEELLDDLERELGIGSKSLFEHEFIPPEPFTSSSTDACLSGSSKATSATCQASALGTKPSPTNLQVPNYADQAIKRVEQDLKNVAFQSGGNQREVPSSFSYPSSHYSMDPLYKRYENTIKKMLQPIQIQENNNDEFAEIIPSITEKIEDQDEYMKSLNSSFGSMSIYCDYH